MKLLRASNSRSRWPDRWTTAILARISGDLRSQRKAKVCDSCTRDTLRMLRESPGKALEIGLNFEQLSMSSLLSFHMCARTCDFMDPLTCVFCFLSYFLRALAHVHSHTRVLAYFTCACFFHVWSHMCTLICMLPRVCCHVCVCVSTSVTKSFC